MSRKPVLTEEHKRIIDEHIDMFPAEIKKLPGMEDPKVSRSVIANYQKKVNTEKEPDDGEELAEVLKRYISAHGLPSRFHGRNNVTGFLEFLDQ